MQGCVRGNFKHTGGEAGRENRPGDFSVDFSVDFFVDFFEDPLHNMYNTFTSNSKLELSLGAGSENFF